MPIGVGEKIPSGSRLTRGIDSGCRDLQKRYPMAARMARTNDTSMRRMARVGGGRVVRGNGETVVVVAEVEDEDT
jgi:hypothetical protein